MLTGTATPRGLGIVELQAASCLLFAGEPADPLLSILSTGGDRGARIGKAEVSRTTSTSVTTPASQSNTEKAASCCLAMLRY